MTQVNDLTNQVFGKLTVLERAENDKHGKARWLCQCECGNTKIINGSSLIRGLTLSCGCNRLQKLKQRNEKNIIDETGNIYGYLTVVSRNLDPELQKDGRAMWNCLCKCGKTCVVMGKNLRDGHTTSCGCRKQSLGEEKIENILLSNNIDYALEYSVKIEEESSFCRVRFDFAIFKNTQLKYFIEYDGEQHFKKTQWDLEENQKRDYIKNQWCKKNGIPLIRIPYTHFDKICIEDLLLETSKFIII